MEFKEKLKELRKNRGKSQTELAKEIFVSRSTIAKWENGLGLPSDDNLKSLCEYFNVDENYFKEKDEKDWENYKLLLVKRAKKIKIITITSFIVAILLIINIINFCLLPEKGKTFEQNGNTYIVLENKEIYGEGIVELIETKNDEVIIPDTITVMARMIPDTFKVVSVYTSAVEGKSVHLPRYFEKFMDSRPLEESELKQYPKETLGISGIRIYDMNLENIYVSKDNKLYDSREDCGCLIDSLTDTIIINSSNSFIPNGIKRIAYEGFNKYFWGKETKYVIPDSIEKLDSYAFGYYLFDNDVTDSEENNFHVDFIDFGSVKELNGYLMIYSWLQDNATIILPKTLEKIERTAFVSSSKPSAVNIFYEGTKSDWNNVNIYSKNIDEKNLYIADNTQIKIYYYSEAEPVEKDVYWHYNTNNEIEIWK